MTMRTISSGHTFLESPRWHDGDLYVSDFFAHEVLRFHGGDGAPEVVATVPGIPSGLGFLPDGTLLIVSMVDRSIYRAVDGKLTLYANLEGAVRGVPNDMLVDADGRCYVGSTGHSPGDETDFGPSPLAIVQPSGEVTAYAAADLNFPNGIVKLPDGRVLVAETYGGTVRALVLDANGVPTSADTWAHWGPDIPYFDIDRAHSVLEVEPDGLAVGRDNTVWVGDANGHGIARVREGGETLEFVDTGDLSVFAALAVDSRLYMCCSPRNRTVDWSVLHSSELRVAEIE